MSFQSSVKRFVQTARLNKIPRTFRLLGVIVAVQLVFFSLLRILFWAYFNSPQDPLSSPEILQAFYLGLKFDLRAVLLADLPLLLLCWLRPIALFGVRGRKILLIYQSLVFAALLLGYVFQAGYYAYLKLPLDATILRFAENFTISMTMVWQSYPVVWVSLLLIVILIGHVYFLRAVHAWIAQSHVSPRTRWQGFSVVSLLGFLTLFAMYGKISWYPLRWSDAYFSTHPFTAAVASNPLLHLMETYKNKDDSFDVAALRKAYPTLVDYLGIDQPDAETLNFTRERVTHAPLAKKQPNIVLVYLESFASYKSSLSGNPLDPTPAIAQMAKQSIYFDNYFVPHTGTARSVFTGITGLPDIEVNDTSTRNPLIARQHTIVSEFKDYQKMYFIGGSASWGNIRGLLHASIDGLQLYEEGSYKAPDVDVWGISDIELFHEANEVLASKSDKPFFAVIQTSGNHRPYTIPENSRGFQFTHYRNEEVIKHGFESKEEFESFRFMDHCVGYFLQQAKKAPYFDNTIFVFFGDHGINAPTGDHVPKSEHALGLQSLRVPLIFYAPGMLEPRLDHRVASEVDVLPSIAGLAVERFTNTTLGRNVFNPRFDQTRMAITVEHHGSDFTLGLLSDSFYFRSRDYTGTKELLKLGNANPREDMSGQFPEQRAKYENLLNALKEFVRYQRFHNPPLDKHHHLAQR